MKAKISITTFCAAPDNVKCWLIMDINTSLYGASYQESSHYIGLLSDIH